MSGTTALLPFQPTEMSPAQLAAVSYLAVTPGTLTSCTPSTYDAGSLGAKAMDLTRCEGFNEPMSSSTSVSSATRD